MHEVTRILSAIDQGDPQAAEKLLPLVYTGLWRQTEDAAQLLPLPLMKAMWRKHPGDYPPFLGKLVAKEDFPCHLFRISAQSVVEGIVVTDPMEPDISELLTQVRRGDKSAADRLLGRHRDRLRRMVAVRMDDRLSARIDASDVVQETLMVAARQLANYLRDPPLPLYAWLRQIAWNRLLALHRRHLEADKRSISREQALELSGASAIQLAERLACRESGPLRRAVRKEMCQRVRAALSALAESDREILILRHLEQLSYGDCAAILKITEVAAKQRHVHALRRIRGLLDDDVSGASL